MESAIRTVRSALVGPADSSLARRLIRVGAVLTAVTVAYLAAGVLVLESMAGPTIVGSIALSSLVAGIVLVGISIHSDAGPS